MIFNIINKDNDIMLFLQDIKPKKIIDTNTTTITTHFSEKFENEIIKNRFISLTK